MKTIHQQITEARADLEACEVKARSVSADPRDAHEAGERIPFIRERIAQLETDAELCAAALHQMRTALVNARTAANGSNGSRDLSTSITELETAEWRMTRHLGEPPATKTKKR